PPSRPRRAVSAARRGAPAPGARRDAPAHFGTIPRRLRRALAGRHERRYRRRQAGRLPAFHPGPGQRHRTGTPGAATAHGTGRCRPRPLATTAAAPGQLRHPGAAAGGTRAATGTAPRTTRQRRARRPRQGPRQQGDTMDISALIAARPATGAASSDATGNEKAAAGGDFQRTLSEARTRTADATAGLT